MPTSSSAKKRLRQNEKRRVRNRVYRSRARTYVKRADEFIGKGDLDEATLVAKLAAGALDKAAQKGIVHKKNAARRKARLYRRLHRATSETGE